MKNPDTFSDLEPFDRRILVYIHRMFHHPTRKDIEAFFFPDFPLGKKERYVQRRLEHLVRRKYISYHTSLIKESNRQEREYHLLTRGARAIGVELKRQDYKPQGKGIYESRKAKSSLAYIVHKEAWSLLEDEEEMRLRLFAIVQDAEEKRGSERPRAANIMGIIPEKISPDMLLTTNSQNYIVIIADRLAEKGYFRRRLERYEKIIDYMPLVFIVLFSRQLESAKSALRGASFLESDKLISPKEAAPILIVSLNEINALPSILK